MKSCGPQQVFWTRYGLILVYCIMGRRLPSGKTQHAMIGLICGQSAAPEI